MLSSTRASVVVAVVGIIDDEEWVVVLVLLLLLLLLLASHLLFRPPADGIVCAADAVLFLILVRALAPLCLVVVGCWSPMYVRRYVGVWYISIISWKQGFFSIPFNQSTS